MQSQEDVEKRYKCLGTKDNPLDIICRKNQLYNWKCNTCNYIFEKIYNNIRRTTEDTTTCPNCNSLKKKEDLLLGC